MFGKRRVTIALALMMIVGLFLVGCGGQEADKEDNNGLERVQTAGEISFAMSGGYPPFNFYDDQNQLVGFDVDVAREIATRLEVDFAPITTDWSGIIEGLRAGVYDGILGSMAITEVRLEVVDFSVPYYYSGAQLMVREGSEFTAPLDLKGKTIGVVTATTFENDAAELGAGDVRLYRDDNQTIMELNSGAVDAIITDRVVGVNAMNNERFDIEMLGSPLRSEDIAVAFRKDDASLTSEVNRILEEMHADGTLKELSEKWLEVDITTK